ncbi:LPXTG cell wall anchor domain-containing protein [Streptococcus sp.]
MLLQRYRQHQKQPGLPNTGTESGVVALVVAVMSTVAGLVVLTKKKEMNA